MSALAAVHPFLSFVDISSCIPTHTPGRREEAHTERPRVHRLSSFSFSSSSSYRIRDVGLFLHLESLNSRVCFRRKDIDDRMRMSMKSYTASCLQKLPRKRTQTKAREKEEKKFTGGRPDEKERIHKDNNERHRAHIYRYVRIEQQQEQVEQPVTPFLSRTGGARIQ